MENFYLAFFILLLPGLVFLVLLLAQKKGDAWGGGLATGALLGVALLALVLAGRLWGSPGHSLSLPWFSLNRRIYFDLDFRLDSLGGLMIALVALVSALVHLFSLAYMRRDPAKTRYFAYLGLFTFAMLGLVMSDNLLVMYLFWELVGLSSYLLIGFWYEKPAAFRAAKKAFLLNRIGDAGFLTGIILVYQAFGTWQISEIAHQLFQNHTQLPVSHAYFTLTGFFLFCGAMAKSAQFPLQIWLPDAMEGPTPVSALIHAATMVAAGVYLVARLYFMLNIEVLSIIACVGTITAFIGAFSALVQSDLKKVLAYSTISQLGFMMMGMGVGAYSAGMLHLFTHAFFKAGLFLGAGAILHALHEAAHTQERHFDAQNIYLMGGLARALPWTSATFLICAAALAGLPFFSGFLSKDAILSGTLAWASVMAQADLAWFYAVPGVAFLSTLLTPLYVGRLVLLVFAGEFRLDALHRSEAPLKPHLREVGIAMKIPLFIFALGSLWFWFSPHPAEAAQGSFYAALGTDRNYFLQGLGQTQLEAARQAHHSLTLALSLGLGLAGLGLAYVLHRFGLFRGRNFRKTFRPFFRLGYSGFFQSQAFQVGLVQPGLYLSRQTARFDQFILDGLVNFLARLQVVLAHVLAWFDRALVDGLVRLLAYLVRSLGNLARHLPGQTAQGYLAGLMVLLGLLLLGWWQLAF